MNDPLPVTSRFSACSNGRNQRNSVIFAVQFVFCILGTVVPSIASDIRFLTLEEPPTNYLKDGEISGTTVDLVNEMARRLGEQPEIEFLPTARAFLKAQSNPNCLVFTAGLTEERKALGYQPIGPVITRRHILFARSGSNFEISSVEDIVARKLTVSGVDGDWRTGFLLSEGVTVETTSQHLLNFRKLMAERTDLWISSDLEAPSILSQAGADPSAIEIAFVFRSAPSYILASRGTDEKELARWRGVFSELTRDTVFLERLSNKWSLELGLDLGFSGGEGFHIKSGPARKNPS